MGELSSIKTGSSDLQDAVPDGAYPFFVRSDEVKRSNRYLYDGEAILVPGEGRLGEIFHYIVGKFDYHQRVYKISDFNDIRGKFVYHAMRHSFKDHALRNTAKATVDSIRLPTLTEFEFYAPVSDEEQRLVASSLDALDNLITLHQRKRGMFGIRNGAWSGMTKPLALRTPRTVSSPFHTPTVARIDEADGADAAATEVVSSERPFALRGMPRGSGADLSRDIVTRCLNVRVSDGELEALDRASAEMGCSRSQAVRLLIHCLADGRTRMGTGTVAFDYETSHGIVRNRRSIGTLYNQSVAALNTIDKVAHES